MSLDTTQLVTDAKAAGGALLNDAKTAGESLVTALAGSADAAVPTLVTDGEKTLLEFVPAFIRPLVESAAGASVSSVDAAALALIKQGLGIALTRIAAL